MRDTEQYPSPVRGAAPGTRRPCAEWPTAERSSTSQRMNRISRHRLGHRHDRGRRAADRRRQGARAARAPVLREHRARQRHDGQPRHAARPRTRRCRASTARRTRTASAMKLVTPSGEILEVDESDPELLQARTLQLRALRDRVRGDVQGPAAPGDGGRAQRLQGRRLRAQAAGASGPRAVDHDVHLPVPRPHRGRVPPVHGPARRRRRGPPPTRLWKLRNYVWKTFMPGFGRRSWSASSRSSEPRYRPGRSVQPGSSDPDVPRLEARHTVPTDQMIRYPEEVGRLALHVQHLGLQGGAVRRDVARVLPVRQGLLPADRLPAQHAPRRLPDRAGRQLPLLVHLRWAACSRSIRSRLASPGGGTSSTPTTSSAAITTASRSSTSPGGSSRTMLRKAFGDRIETFEEYRKRFDPNERLLNSYFRELFQGSLTGGRLSRRSPSPSGISTRFAAATSTRPWRAGRAGGIDHLAPVGELRVPDEWLAYFGELFAAIPDWEYEVLNLFEQGDQVACHSARHGPFLGRSRSRGSARPERRSPPRAPT